MRQSAYIDVRGPHPVYVKGMTAILLEGHARTISVEVAEDLIEHGSIWRPANERQAEGRMRRMEVK